MDREYLDCLAQAIKTVLLKEGKSLKSLQKRAKQGFWKKVVEAFPDNDLDYVINDTNLRNKFSDNRQIIMQILEADEQPSLLKPDPLQDAHKTEKQPETPLQAISLSLDDLHQLIEKAVQDKVTALKNSIRNEHDNIELVPEPETVKGKKGRKLERKFVKKTLTIDEVLWARFDQESKTLRVEKSRLLDSILWVHYGKPNLSYGSQ